MLGAWLELCKLAVSLLLLLLKVVYMGKDKYENEELLKYGFPEDLA